MNFEAFPSKNFRADNWRHCKSKHMCGCGEAITSPHEVGTFGCKRLMTNKPIQLDGGMWNVEGQIVTDYTLRFQRGYYFHDACGCASRYPESTISMAENETEQ